MNDKDPLQSILDKGARSPQRIVESREIAPDDEPELKPREYKAWGAYPVKYAPLVPHLLIHAGWDQTGRVVSYHPKLALLMDDVESDGHYTLIFNHMALRLEGENLFENLHDLRMRLNMGRLHYLLTFDAKHYDPIPAAAPKITAIRYRTSEGNWV